MSASYLGTFPVKRLLSSQQDANGVLTASASIVDREGDISSHVPAINSEFEFDTNLWVTSADVSYPGNGLAEVTVAASGPPVVSTARVFVTPGGPRIYGLRSSGLAPLGGLTFPTGYHPTNGQSVEVTFVTSADQSEQMVITYLGAQMPSSILDTELPAPAARRGPILDSTLQPPPVTVPGITPGVSQEVPRSFQGNYGGFVCKDVILQPQGRALLVRLVFREEGFLIVNGTTLFNY